MHIRSIEKPSKRIPLPFKGRRRTERTELDPNLVRALHEAVIHRMVR